MTATARPPQDGASPATKQPPELGAAIRAALGYLADLTDPPSAVHDGRLDGMLRAALTAHPTPTPTGAAGDGHQLAMDEVACAVRAACAHLAANELEDAYLALRAAADRVPRPAG